MAWEARCRTEGYAEKQVTPGPGTLRQVNVNTAVARYLARAKCVFSSLIDVCAFRGICLEDSLNAVFLYDDTQSHVLLAAA